MSSLDPEFLNPRIRINSIVGYVYNKNWKIIREAYMFSSNCEKSLNPFFWEDWLHPSEIGREIAGLDDWKMKSCIFHMDILFFASVKCDFLSHPCIPQE